jgi:hypothetical protein
MSNTNDVQFVLHDEIFGTQRRNLLDEFALWIVPQQSVDIFQVQLGAALCEVEQVRVRIDVFQMVRLSRRSRMN